VGDEGRTLLAAEAKHACADRGVAVDGSVVESRDLLVFLEVRLEQRTQLLLAVPAEGHAQDQSHEWERQPFEPDRREALSANHRCEGAAPRSSPAASFSR
jgi:hypothetical protein